MRRIFLEIAYDGTAYAGWQVQKNALSVQIVFGGGSLLPHQILHYLHLGLLAQADPDVDLRTPGNLGSRLRILAAQDSASADLARYIIQSWQKNLGIYASLELVSEETLAARLASGNYQLAVAVTTGSGMGAGESLAAFASDSPRNYANLNNSKVDKAAHAALGGEPKAVAALEKAVSAQCPCLSLSYPARYYAVAADTEEIRILPFSESISFLSAKKWDD